MVVQSKIFDIIIKIIRKKMSSTQYRCVYCGHQMFNHNHQFYCCNPNQRYCMICRNKPCTTCHGPIEKLIKNPKCRLCFLGDDQLLLQQNGNCENYYCSRCLVTRFGNTQYNQYLLPCGHKLHPDTVHNFIRGRYCKLCGKKAYSTTDYDLVTGDVCCNECFRFERARIEDLLFMCTSCNYILKRKNQIAVFSQAMILCDICAKQSLFIQEKVQQLQNSRKKQQIQSTNKQEANNPKKGPQNYTNNKQQKLTNNFVGEPQPPKNYQQSPIPSSAQKLSSPKNGKSASNQKYQIVINKPATPKKSQEQPQTQPQVQPVNDPNYYYNPYADKTRPNVAQAQQSPNRNLPKSKSKSRQKIKLSSKQKQREQSKGKSKNNSITNTDQFQQVQSVLEIQNTHSGSYKMKAGPQMQVSANANIINNTTVNNKFNSPNSKSNDASNYNMSNTQNLFQNNFTNNPPNNLYNTAPVDRQKTQQQNKSKGQQSSTDSSRRTVINKLPSNDSMVLQSQLGSLPEPKRTMKKHLSMQTYIQKLKIQIEPSCIAQTTISSLKTCKQCQLLLSPQQIFTIQNSMHELDSYCKLCYTVITNSQSLGFNMVRNNNVLDKSRNRGISNQKWKNYTGIGAGLGNVYGSIGVGQGTSFNNMGNTYLDYSGQKNTGTTYSLQQPSIAQTSTSSPYTNQPRTNTTTLTGYTQSYLTPNKNHVKIGEKIPDTHQRMSANVRVFDSKSYYRDECIVCKQTGQPTMRTVSNQNICFKCYQVKRQGKQ